MAQKKNDNAALDRLALAISSDQLDRLYIFHGEERYLLERRLGEIRQKLSVGGFEGFNVRRYEGAKLSADELTAAVYTLPAFAERTLIEVHDFDLFKGGDETKTQLLELFSDMPDYACLILVYDTIAYKPDKRQSLAAVIAKHASVVEFTVQETARLMKWIKMHFADGGKRIDNRTAEHLAFITGGLMATLDSEIEKVIAYSRGEIVTVEDIDAVVVPVLDAVTYKLADAIARGGFDDAVSILDELLRMREAPHKLIYSISLKLRQLLAARICIEDGAGERGLMDMCGIRYPFQAKMLLDSARKTSLAQCRDAVLLCTETAYELNSGSDPEARITELLTKLAVSRRGRAV